MRSFGIALGIYAANFVGILAIRLLLKKVFPKGWYPYVAEFLCSFLLVANVFENGNILMEYGVASFALCLFTLIIASMFLFDAFANPVSTFDLVWNGKMPVFEGGVKVLMQVAGGCLAARCMVLLWATYPMTDQHSSRASFLSAKCFSTNQVSIPLGIAVELGGTIILRIIVSYSTGFPRFEKVLNSFSAVTVVVLGLEWTGSMLNPALATAMTYNCENHPFYEHLLVYWLAPFAGSAISDKIEDFLHGPGWRDKTSVVKDEVGVIKNGKKKRPARRYSKGKKNNSSEISVVPNGKSQKEQNGHVARRRKRANGKKALNNNVQS